MVEKNDVYKCEVCGNIVEVVHAGGGELVCCEKPMVRQKENFVDAAKEKHVPVVEKTETGFKVSVGSVAHPMDSDHYIEWIELLVDDRACLKYLQPGDEPIVEFFIHGDNPKARAYCNLHGLWASK